MSTNTGTNKHHHLIFMGAAEELLLGAKQYLQQTENNEAREKLKEVFVSKTARTLKGKEKLQDIFLGPEEGSAKGFFFTMTKNEIAIVLSGNEFARTLAKYHLLINPHFRKPAFKDHVLQYTSAQTPKQKASYVVAQHSTLPNPPESQQTLVNHAQQGMIVSVDKHHVCNLAQKMARDFPYLDAVFSSIAYLWDHESILNSLPPTTTESREVVKDFKHCPGCGYLPRICVYTWIIHSLPKDPKDPGKKKRGKEEHIRCFSCLCCGQPTGDELYTWGGKKHQVNQRDYEILQAQWLPIEDEDNICWWKNALPLIKRCTTIGKTSKEWFDYCIGLVELAKTQDSFKYSIPKEVPCSFIHGDFGIAQEFEEWYTKFDSEDANQYHNPKFEGKGKSLEYCFRPMSLQEGKSSTSKPAWLPCQKLIRHMQVDFLNDYMGISEDDMLSLITPPSYCQGCLSDHLPYTNHQREKVGLKGSGLHADTASAVNILTAVTLDKEDLDNMSKLSLKDEALKRVFSWTGPHLTEQQEEETDSQAKKPKVTAIGFFMESAKATWLIISPSAISYAKKWRDNILWEPGKKKYDNAHSPSGIIIPKALMEEFLHDAEANGFHNKVWVIDQKHGDVIYIPPGYAHAVVNMTPSFKVAMDFIPEGTLFQCMISQVLVHTVIGRKLTIDYMEINKNCFDQVTKHVFPTKAHSDGTKTHLWYLDSLQTN